jgi:mannose-6-phosphate isomerase-like protein (cupin superfamily)
MDIRVVNLKEKAGQIHELHAYKLIARLNDYHFKLVKARREFVWHHHDKTDEMFMVIEGKMKIALRDKTLELGEGELVVIPRGVEHKPVCEELCTVLLVEPAGTTNTGNAGGSLTDTRVEWI